MPMWGSIDQSNNSPIWAAAKINQAPTATNRDAMYGNTTANAAFAGATVATYGISQSEIAVHPEIPHTGWVMKTTGQGGRAGRVTYEVMVAGGLTGDGDANTVNPDVSNTTNFPAG